jgi:hypothetical protein
MSYRSWNLWLGWGVFVLSLILYLCTLESSASFWDCGEFILASHKLQVGHSPGAPLYLLLARIFSLASGDVATVAVWVNAFSGLCSALTVMFLFWTITYFARRILSKCGIAFKEASHHAGDELVGWSLWMVLGAGLVGALTYAVSDTFWFSAVEGEVYALSSLFTAVVFWSILRWEAQADSPDANRWLMLIAFLVGLSIGVHLLNLLAVPAMIWVYYYRKYVFSRFGFFKATLVAVGLLAVILFGIIPGTIQGAIWSELLFVNGFGFPFHTGVWAWSLGLSAFLILGTVITYRKRKRLLHHLFLGTLLILLGYGSYALVVIRSFANPPMDQNDPEDVFSLQGYLNRSQYGDRPLWRGAWYNAPLTDRQPGEPLYGKNNGRYEITGYYVDDVYAPEFITFFPRMYSREPAHAESYRSWTRGRGAPVTFRDGNGQLRRELRLDFVNNLEFFFGYQLGHMYLRYFLWNFSGRQDDMQGYGGVLHGNWITGIPFLDAWRTGPAVRPESLQSRGYNRYFALPLILGLMGFFFQWRRSRADGSVVLALFVMTGIAIVVYLNQTPDQPRERDYAFAGSFYAFAIWVGLGLMALMNAIPLARRNFWIAGAILGGTLLLVPVWMFSQNLDDHDRSGRTLARDMGVQFLQSCPPNAILFTYGDNDTYPLWYVQEVEGVRTDVRVVNLTYLYAGWYVQQMTRKVYDSEPLPLPEHPEAYLPGGHSALVDSLVRNRSGRPVCFSMTVPARYYGSYRRQLVQQGLVFRYDPNQVAAVSEGEVTDGIRSDTDWTYRQLVDSASWGTLHQQGVYPDETCRRMMNTIRGVYLHLALELVFAGRTDSAVRALDAMEARLPRLQAEASWGGQWQSSSLMPVLTCYMAGATSKANDLADECYRTLRDELDYFNRFPRRMSGSVRDYVQDREQTLASLKELAQKYGQPQLLRKWDRLP